MQKKLLTIAVAGALAAPLAAFAQQGVQIYGVIDLQAMHQKFDDDAAGTGDVSKAELHDSASRLGFRGRESLGGGLNAWFQAEMGISARGRPDPNNTANGVNWLGGRDTAVGLDGNWGTIMLGGWGTPYKVANLATWNLGSYGIVSHYGLMMNQDSTGTEPGVACGTGTSCSGTLINGSATAFGRRAANSVQYWTPNWGGFQGRIGTTLSGLKTADGAAVEQDPSLWSLSLMWSGGPFTVGGAYERHEEFRNAVAGGPKTKDDAWMIGGKWRSGAFAVGAAYELRDYDNNSATAGAETNFEIKSWVVNGTFNLGSGEIFAGYSQMETDSCGAGLTTCGNAGEADLLTLGYAHNLSKRTKAYINVGNIDNGSATAIYWIAGPAGNSAASSGQSGGINAGTDVRTVGVGIQHSF